MGLDGMSSSELEISITSVIKINSIVNGSTRWPGRVRKRPRLGSCQAGGYKGLQGEQGCVNEPVLSSGKNDFERKQKKSIASFVNHVIDATNSA
jgi:hypothetical protein